jgi:hypothetical protein
MECDDVLGFEISLYICLCVGPIFFIGLLLAQRSSSSICTIRALMGNRDGELGNVTFPASPDRDEFWLVKSPAGMKNGPFSSPNG